MSLAVVVAGLAVSASSAKACEAVNRTREQTLELQRRLASTADSIYLARAVPVRGDYMSTYHRITVIDGATPPRRLKDLPEDCGLADEGLTVVFAQRVRPSYQFDGWFWGGWALSAFYPSEIVDPDMATALREAAERLRSN
nr:hypothetical protein [uncultured Brevundimonas sp.]